MLGSYRFIDEVCRDNVFVKPFSWNVFWMVKVPVEKLKITLINKNP